MEEAPAASEVVPLRALDTDGERQLNKLLAASDQADAALELGEFAAQTRVASTSRTSVPRGSRNGIYGISAASGALLGLDAGRPDHFAPLLGFVGDQLAKIGRGAGKHRAS